MKSLFSIAVLSLLLTSTAVASTMDGALGQQAQPNQNLTLTEKIIEGFLVVLPKYKAFADSHDDANAANPFEHIQTLNTLVQQHGFTDYTQFAMYMGKITQGMGAVKMEEMAATNPQAAHLAGMFDKAVSEEEKALIKKYYDRLNELFDNK